jgi:hypothetical protein
VKSVFVATLGTEAQVVTLSLLELARFELLKGWRGPIEDVITAAEAEDTFNEIFRWYGGTNDGEVKIERNFYRNCGQ